MIWLLFVLAFAGCQPGLLYWHDAQTGASCSAPTTDPERVTCVTPK